MRNHDLKNFFLCKKKKVSYEGNILWHRYVYSCGVPFWYVKINHAIVFRL